MERQETVDYWERQAKISKLLENGENTQHKYKTWNDIWENDELLAGLWNQFIKEDVEVAKEAEDYGEKYMKVYPNTYEGILEAYGGKPDNFIKDNMSFWGDEERSDCPGSVAGYRFEDSWFRLDVSSSEEEFVTTDTSAGYIIQLIIDSVLKGTIDDATAKKRFREFCVAKVNN